MKILFINNTGLTLGLAMRCRTEGHNVSFSSQTSVGIGLVHPYDGSNHNDLTIFDSSKDTMQAEEARQEGQKVIGPSRWGTMLEHDNTYKSQIIASMGLSTNGVSQGTNFYISLWFNGSSVISSYISILYRRFTPGGAGPDLYCTGMLGFFGAPSKRTTEALIAPLVDLLKKIGHQGVVHMHVLADGDNICVKDLSVSFAHPLSLLLYENTNLTTGNILKWVTTESSKPIASINNWASGIHLSIPPYPYGGLIDKPIFLDGINEENLKHLWLVDINQRSRQYEVVNRGIIGYVTARGVDECECVRRMYRTAGRLRAPDWYHIQYRNDIGKNVQSLINTLRQPGWLS